MIEKLDPIKHTDNLFDNNGFITNVACGGVVISKVNELIDAVNNLQESQNTYWTDIAEIKKELQTRAENVQDKFSEQRKWIGKLCKFRDDETDKPMIGVLKDIDVFVGDNNAFYITFLNAADNNTYFECEPVKPDSEFIYHGE